MAIETQGSNLYAIDPDTCQLFEVGCVTSMDIDATNEQIETTCLSDQTRTYQAGLLGPGAATFQLNVDPSDETNLRMFQMRSEGKLIKFALGWSENPDLAPYLNTADCDFILPQNRSWIVFEGFISNFSFNFSQNSIVTSAVSVQISNDAVLIPADSEDAPIVFDFLTPFESHPLIAFTRASVKQVFDSNGNLIEVPANVPAFDHDPATGEVLGLFTEEASTNFIRNNTMQGGGAGVAPNNWIVSDLSAYGLTRQILGVGSENGIEYMDLRIFGTVTSSSTSAFFVSPEPTTQVAASNGQTWNSSYFLSLIGGSLSGISAIRLSIVQRDSDGTFISQIASNISVESGPLRTQRKNLTVTLNESAVARITNPLAISVPTVGAAVDVTLRIGLPQLENKWYPTSVIKTYGTNASRGADSVQAKPSSLLNWLNTSEGTFSQQYQLTSKLASSSGLILNNGGSALDQIRVVSATGAGSQGSVINVVVGGTQAISALPSAEALSVNLKVALAFSYGASGYKISRRGSAVASASAAVPVINNLIFSSTLNGYLQRVKYWPYVVSDSELIKQSALI